MTLTLIGAYGRVYPNVSTMIKDWFNGKDFKILNGPYCSIRDIRHIAMQYDTIELLTDSGETMRLADSYLI